jgi:hypothetical protein
MLRGIIICWFVCVAAQIKAQTFEVPVDYVLDSTADFGQYEQSVIDCFNWLMEAPCNVDLVKREAASTFLNKWIEGTPSVIVTINANVLTYMDTSPDLILIFMGGWAVHTLQSEDDNDVSGSLSGTYAVLDYYNKNIDFLRKDEHIDKLIKYRKKGKLEKFIR